MNPLKSSFAYKAWRTKGHKRKYTIQISQVDTFLKHKNIFISRELDFWQCWPGENQMNLHALWLMYVWMQGDHAHRYFLIYPLYIYIPYIYSVAVLATEPSCSSCLRKTAVKKCNWKEHRIIMVACILVEISCSYLHAL